MATSYLSPGVYVEEVDRGTKPLEMVGTSTVGSPYSLRIVNGSWTSTIPGTPTQDPRINKNLQANVGTQWRPSSNHPGIVIVSFCDCLMV